MIVESRIQLIPGTRFFVLALFVLLVLIQILDAHSTLTASAGHYETNRAINWLINRVGFTAAVCITKAWCAFVLLILYRVWRLSNGSHDREFIVSLTLIGVIYGVVVANNYLS